MLGTLGRSRSCYTLEQSIRDVTGRNSAEQQAGECSAERSIAPEAQYGPDPIEAEGDDGPETHGG